MPIPRRRVMNWWENGVREPDAKGRWCSVRVQEANVPANEIGAAEVQRSLRMCNRQPCVCRGESPNPDAPAEPSGRPSRGQSDA